MVWRERKIYTLLFAPNDWLKSDYVSYYPIIDLDITRYDFCFYAALFHILIIDLNN